ncbi:MAG: hypothetical protein NXI16_14950 [Alphaproteobacteria bacterium]|nr:hypothetical protein [Alphaproteobacteria bacterium]
MVLRNLATRGVLVSGLVAGLSACAGDVLVTQGGFAPLGQEYLREQLQAANARGPVLVEVTGPALGESAEALATRIAASIKGIPPGINPEFTSDPAKAGSTSYRVVYGFDVPNQVGAYQVCEKGSYTPVVDPNGPDRLKLVVAFCYKDGSENHLIARRGAIASADAPDFTETVNQATFELFRPGFDDRRGSNDQFESL